MSDLVHQIAGLIHQHQRFVVLTHYRPDGDAIGCQLAVALLLRQLGKQVTVWNDDEVPAKFRFLPGQELVQPPPATPRDFDAAIVVDNSVWSRVGTSGERIGQRKCLINIDHHVSNQKFGDVNWVVPEAPATGILIHQLFQRGGFNVDRDIATCLYAAIATDTGNFTYPTTTAESLRAAADLVAAGVNVGELCQHIYESYPFARMKLLRLALADLTLAHHNRIAYYWLTNDMFQQSGAKREDTEGLIDHARSIEGVVVAVVFEELPETGKLRLSFRSKHPQVDVNSIARHFGGGGHHAAAGARIAGDPREVEAKVLAAITQALIAAGL
jgi:phosphoesterase RecJ-like protein